MASLLKGASIKHFDILGCSGASIAGELATLVPRGIRIGYLRNRRQDNIEVDPATLMVKKLTIDPQTLFHYDGQMQ
jgi:hypothetical protein